MKKLIEILIYFCCIFAGSLYKKETSQKLGRRTKDTIFGDVCGTQDNTIKMTNANNLQKEK